MSRWTHQEITREPIKHGDDNDGMKEVGVRNSIEIKQEEKIGRV